MKSKRQSFKIAVVGTGVIGASWTAYFLARGFPVAATDPAPGAEDNLRKLIGEFWPTLEKRVLDPSASQDNLSFHTRCEDAVSGAAFIQENGPERVDIKRVMLETISGACPEDTLIATSSSGILISDIQDAAKNPARVLLGHPFNPPHLIPLVEVVGGKLTSPEAIQQALDFYTDIGKKPIHVKREVKGHVANRLQAALWREAFYLMKEGIASVSDLDTAIAHGPGLRWALLGPFMNLHLSGGSEGIGHVIDHLGPPIENWWRDLGDLSFTAEVRAEAVEGVDEELVGRQLNELIEARDDILIKLMDMKAEAKQLP